MISIDTDDEDAADADAEATSRKRKKGMSEVEKKTAMWQRLTASPCVIDTTTIVPVVKGGPPKSREDIYMESGFVTCRLDGTTYNVGLFMGNHSQHLKSAKHVNAVKKAAPAGGINLFVMKKGPGLNAEQLAARNTCLKEIRILGHAAAIGLGSNPRQIMVQSSGIMDDVKQALKGSPYSIGSSEHTVARDRDVAVTLLLLSGTSTSLPATSLRSALAPCCALTRPRGRARSSRPARSRTTRRSRATLSSSR